jgi:tRNA A37 threonylcarbamoyladenosine dehydratase
LTPRRFSGVARVFGDEAFARIAAAHVCVIGLGGVGSWAAEALARSGVGRLTLIDLDHVAESNLNRQVLALESTLGAAKVEAMQARIADIAPECRVSIVDDFVTPENAAQRVPPDAIVVDAIDQVRAKVALVALCRERRQKLVVCGGAGGRHDPLRLRRDDLAGTKGDALLSSLRARLRREHGFPREPGKRFGVEAIYSDEHMTGGRASGDTSQAGAAQSEAAQADAAQADGAQADAAQAGGAGLSCAGYGSLVTVTAAMGMAAAARALDFARAARR